MRLEEILLHNNEAQLHDTADDMKPVISVCPGAPTRLTVNIAAVAAANKVHWTVPQNLLRKPETHAHLEKHKIRYLISVLNIFY